MTGLHWFLAFLLGAIVLVRVVGPIRTDYYAILKDETEKNQECGNIVKEVVCTDAARRIKTGMNKRCTDCDYRIKELTPWREATWKALNNAGLCPNGTCSGPLLYVVSELLSTAKLVITLFIIAAAYLLIQHMRNWHVSANSLPTSYDSGLGRVKDYYAAAKPAPPSRDTSLDTVVPARSGNWGPTKYLTWSLGGQPQRRAVRR